MRLIGKYKLLIAAIALVFLLVPAKGMAKKKKTYSAPLPGAYKVFDKYHSSKDGKPELLFVFSFESEPSMKLLGNMAEFERRYEKRVRILRAPVQTGKDTNFPTKLYFIAEEVGPRKARAVMEALFQARFVDKKDLNDLDVLRDIAKANGLSDHFAAWIFDDRFTDKVEESSKLIGRYNLTVTPSAIVNDCLLVTPAIAGGTVEQMQDSIETIFRGLIGW